MGQYQSTEAIAYFHPACNNGIQGSVKFRKNGQCQIKLSGFEPNTEHAIHINEFGDLSGGCKTCGGHYNTKNVTHGSFEYPQNPRHVGDLVNNIKSNNKGIVDESYYLPDIII